MSDKHPCESCSMPIESGQYCAHCVDKDGKLQPFEEPWRKHRAQDEGWGREVVRADPRGQCQTEGREQRPVGPDPVDDRSRRCRWYALRLGHDDPECLPTAELDEDRLARL